MTHVFGQGLLDLVSEHLSTMEPGPEADKVRAHLDQTIAHIKRKQESTSDQVPAFAQLSV